MLGLAGFAVALAVAGAAAWLLPGAVVAIAPLGVALATVLACRGMARCYPHARAGACNLVTLARTAMPALLAAVVLSPTPPGA